MQTKLTIKEIEDKLVEIEDELDPFIQNCKNDGRKGVQQLLHKWYQQKEQVKEEELRLAKMQKYENIARKQGFELIAGIDEVGRGPLAGPVVAAAVILPADCYLPGVNDSKKLTANKRNELYEVILKQAIAVGVGIVHADEIDKINIYESTKKAMSSAIHELSIVPDFLLLDAMKLEVPITQQSLIKGDSLSQSIASASIVAKVYRDRLMEEYSLQYPSYQFDKNMGYGTKEHLNAIERYGPTPIHRMSFAPLKDKAQLTFNL